MAGEVALRAALDRTDLVGAENTVVRRNRSAEEVLREAEIVLVENSAGWWEPLAEESLARMRPGGLYLDVFVPTFGRVVAMMADYLVYSHGVIGSWCDPLYIR